MKNLLFQSVKPLFLMWILLSSVNHLLAQNQDQRLGLPGDNLNLSAVLDVFQQSKTLEAFETSINSNNSKINNLDLNNDGVVDYIKVQDYRDGKMHSIVLQTDVSMSESQDIAVIYVKKKFNGDIDIQIVGDEDLYGENYVIDVNNDLDADGTPNPGYRANDNNDYVYNNSYYSFNNWGIIDYMYDPYYDPWFSPWHWGFYPPNWYGWSPFFWNDYYYHCYHIYPWFWPHYYFSSRNRFYKRHSNWYGQNRRRSEIYNQNRQSGIYEKTYQGNAPVRKPINGDRVGNIPVKTDVGTRNKSIQHDQENYNRSEAPVQKQPDIRRQDQMITPVTPRQEVRRDAPKQAQPPIRQSVPRQAEPVERRIQPANTPPPRQEVRQVPQQIAQPNNNGQTERKIRR